MSAIVPGPVAGVQVAAPQDPASIDAFFAKDADVLKTYKFDYDASAEWATDVAFSNNVIAGLPFSIIFNAPCFYAFEKENIVDKVRAQHLALTRDGIKYVVDKHDQGCRLECQKQGKVSKTVPYDKMTDCDVEEPAGSSGCCLMLVKDTLHVVNVDTASGNRAGGGHELTVRGLIAPEEFKADVWKMKRGEKIAGVSAAVAPMAVSMVRDGVSGASGGGGGDGSLASTASLEAKIDDQTGVLRELLGVMKQQVELLKAK